MKKFGTLLFTSTCSLGAGYYFGNRHQQQRPTTTPIQLSHQTPSSPPVIIVEQKEIINNNNTHAKEQLQVLKENEIAKPEDSVISVQQHVDAPSSSSSLDHDVIVEKAENENKELPTETRRLTTMEEIYQYLEESAVLSEDEKIRWPKYNIQFLSDDTEENRMDTIKLFKTFDGFGIPTHAGSLHLFSHFISVSDSRMRIPLYVAWSIPHLHDGMTVTADRKFSKFTKGDHFNHFTSFNPDNNDYFGSGYSRGHLVNCGDFNFFDQKSMNDTHLLIHNIVPQDFKNNAGYWLRMERFTRSLAFDFDSVHVIAGPAVIPEMHERTEVNGRLQPPKGILKHLVVGKHNVAVPTHLFRIIIAEKHVNNQPEYYAQAFLVPNTEMEKTDELTKYSISLKELEGVTGLKFLDKLEKSGKMLPLCRSFNQHQETIVVSDKDITPSEGPASDKSTDTIMHHTPQHQVQPDLSENQHLNVKYGCNCELPPWQDMDIQELLWKKNVTGNEIEEKWNQLVETTNWTPSRDITERKKAKLEELKH